MNDFTAIGILMVLGTLLAAILIALACAGVQNVIDHWFVAKTAYKAFLRDHAEGKVKVP